MSKLLTRSENRVFMEYEYSYDANGNRTEKTGTIWDGQQEKKESIRFRYDQKNQLLEEQYGEESICYGYDPVGNRIWQEQGGESIAFEYNAGNQLTTRKGKAESSFYQYDKQGNLLEEWRGTEKKQYRYDPLNRQQDVSKADGVFQRNRYDAEGLRAEMEENGRLCRFIFHQGEIVNEERGEDQLVSRYLRGHGVEYLEQEGERFSFQKDEQSSTVFLLDQEQEIQSYYAYDSFGNVRDRQGSVENRILYTGQQYDGMAEQYYLRARYYNPVIGRFIQEDPYRGDGLNLYAYCASNPVRYFDPSGYCSEVKFNEEKGQLAVGARNFMESDDAFYIAISKRSDIDSNGFYDIIGHGTPNTIDININGKIVSVDHRMIARILEHSPEYSGQNIRLLSCSTGAETAGFAQNLANQLGVIVVAPSDYLWADVNGNMFVAGMLPGKRPDYNNIGSFITFTPGNN